MSHTYVSCYVHVIFGTKDRQRVITPELCGRLWAYIGGIARENGFKAIETGGVEDHTHTVLSLPATIAIAKAVQLIKGGSSKWAHDTFPQLPFAWQEGYAAFSISQTGVKNARQYIRQQEHHHRQHTFKEELIAFLEKYEIPYDERYLLD